MEIENLRISDYLSKYNLDIAQLQPSQVAKLLSLQLEAMPLKLKYFLLSDRSVEADLVNKLGAIEGYCQSLVGRSK